MERAVATSILNSFRKKNLWLFWFLTFLDDRDRMEVLRSWMQVSFWGVIHRMKCSCRVGGSCTAALTLFLLLRGRNLEASSSSSSLEATKRGRLHYHSSAKLESRHFLVICIHEFLCLGTLSIAELQLLFFSVLSVVVVLLVVVLKIIISYIESKSSL